MLGGEDFILSQRSGVDEDLFKGSVLGIDADVSPPSLRWPLLQLCSALPARYSAPPPEKRAAPLGVHQRARCISSMLTANQHTAALPQVARVDFRQTSLRSLAHLPAGLRAPPRFLERVAVHYARNALVGSGAMPGPAPLVLGIWGPKVRRRRRAGGTGLWAGWCTGAMERGVVNQPAGALAAH